VSDLFQKATETTTNLSHT